MPPRSPDETDSASPNDILLARTEAKTKCRIAIRFARRHRAQARLDLAALMLGEAALHRSHFRYWHHRFVAHSKRAEADDEPR